MRWLSIISTLIGLTSICDAVPTGSPIRMESLESEPRSPDTARSSSPPSSSLSSARKLPTHDVGLPSELAWQAWLVVANEPDAESSFESATVPRKINAKSIFVAPPLEQCADGYKSDKMGRCVKDTIQINYASHFEFLLQRLKGRFPSNVELDDSAAIGSELTGSAASGPLQVNISLGINDNWSASHAPLSSDDLVREKEDSYNPVQISVVHVPPVEPLKSDQKPVTKTEAELTAYEVENGTKSSQEKEETFFRVNSSQPFQDHSIRGVVVPVAEFVDVGNQTFGEVIDYEIPVALGQFFNGSRGKPSKNNTETKPGDEAQPPTVVLLLSPTKITAETSTPYLKEPESRPGTPTNHILVNSTGREPISEFNTPSEVTTTKDVEEVISTTNSFEDATTPEVPDTVATTIYPEDDPDNGTESIDEILTHGEAGMLVTAGKLTLGSSSGKPTDEDGNISSESSIRGDVILETTLLDLNTGTPPTQTKLADFRELFEAEKELNLTPKVVFSRQDPHRLDRPGTRSTKRDGDPAISLPTPNEAIINLGDPLTSNSRPQEMRYASSQNGHSQSNDDPLSNDRSHLQQRRRTTSSQERVRFPDDQRQSSNSYVVFPSDHSNSINGNLDYKEHPSFRDEGARPQLVPKSSIPVHQKKTYWHLPPGWRIDDLQPPRQPVAVQNSNQRQNPMLLRFWTRMPLFRDPSLAMSNQSSRISPTVAQRENIYRETPPQAVNRGFDHTARGGQVIG